MANVPQVVQRIWFTNLNNNFNIQPLVPLLIDSDIIHLNIAGTSLVVLDTAEAVMDLLERRSLIYSDRFFMFFIRDYSLRCCYRPRMPMVNELMGWSFNFGLMSYGK